MIDEGLGLVYEETEPNENYSELQEIVTKLIQRSIDEDLSRERQSK